VYFSIPPKTGVKNDVLVPLSVPNGTPKTAKILRTSSMTAQLVDIKKIYKNIFKKKYVKYKS